MVSKISELTKSLSDKQTLVDQIAKLNKDLASYKTMYTNCNNENTQINSKFKETEDLNKHLNKKILIYESSLLNRNAELKDEKDTKNKVIKNYSTLETELSSTKGDYYTKFIELKNE